MCGNAILDGMQSFRKLARTYSMLQYCVHRTECGCNTARMRSSHFVLARFRFEFSRNASTCSRPSRPCDVANSTRNNYLLIPNRDEISFRLCARSFAACEFTPFIVSLAPKIETGIESDWLTIFIGPKGWGWNIFLGESHSNTTQPTENRERQLRPSPRIFSSCGCSTNGKWQQETRKARDATHMTPLSLGDEKMNIPAYTH